MLIAALLVISSAKLGVDVGVDSHGDLDFKMTSNGKGFIGIELDTTHEKMEKAHAGDMDYINDMDSTQLKEKVGALLAELRQKNSLILLKNSLIDELSSALEQEKQITARKIDTMIADSKISAGDMDDTVGLAAKNCSAAQAKLDEAHAAFDECLIFSMLP